MNPVERFDAALSRQGFSAPLRRVSLALVSLSLALLLFGCVLLPWVSWPLWLGVGAGLSAWNFLSMAFFVQAAFRRAAPGRNISRKLLWTQILGTNLRLFISGILIYVLWVIFSANLLALMLGLSLTVLLIPLCFFSGTRS